MLGQSEAYLHAQDHKTSIQTQSLHQPLSPTPPYSLSFLLPRSCHSCLLICHLNHPLSCASSSSSSLPSPSLLRPPSPGSPRCTPPPPHLTPLPLCLPRSPCPRRSPRPRGVPPPFPTVLHPPPPPSSRPPPPPLSSLCSSWGSQNGPRVQGLLLHSSLEANGWYLDFRTVGTFVHTPDERETSRHPMNKKSASVNEPRRWQSGFWARQASCAVSELSNNYVTRPREFEACPGSDVHRQLFGRPSKSFPADIWSAGGTDLKSALAGAGFSLHAAERLMRMEQPQVPNCPSLRPGPVGTGFWSVRTRSPANSSAREGKAGKLCED